MNRRIASQVHRQVSRTRLQRITPAWYDAVLEYPPIPLPAKYPPPRSRYDMPTKPTGKMRGVKPRPLDIRYLEDGIRRQFFRDHPFEAFRPTTLVEKGKIEDPHPIQGTEWSRLRQRGRNPTPEEYAYFALLNSHANPRNRFPTAQFVLPSTYTNTTKFLYRKPMQKPWLSSAPYDPSIMSRRLLQ